MPAFYSGRPNVGHMPLTPPGSGPGYRYSSMSYAHENYTQPYQAPCLRHDSLYDYESGYLPNGNVNSLQANPYAQTHFGSNTNLPPISAYYDAAGRSTLPPLRIDDRYSHSGSYQHRLPLDQQTRERQPRQAVKEEKATGGVSATLDYEMEQMTDFVTEAVQSIFQHTMQSAPSFRKWVLQVLSATRLPSATILLSLHYLSDRVTNHSRSIVTGDNQIYRLLAVALILGSKFLDDNTFINRSWSDVTAIKVTELNQLEFEWLELIDYTLHVDPAQRNGLSAWIEAWREYEVRDNIKQVSSRPPPLVTNFTRHQDVHDQRYSAYPSPYSQPSTQSFATPLSARSAHFTPLSYGSSNGWTSTARGVYEDAQKRDTRYPPYPEYDDLSRPAVDYHSRQMNYQFPPLSQSAIYQSAPSYSPWSQSWNTAHRYDCACSDCVYQNQCRPYHQGLGYSSVTAVA